MSGYFGFRLFYRSAASVTECTLSDPLIYWTNSTMHCAIIKLILVKFDNNFLTIFLSCYFLSTIMRCSFVTWADQSKCIIFSYCTSFCLCQASRQTFFCAFLFLNEYCCSFVNSNVRTIKIAIFLSLDPLSISDWWRQTSSARTSPKLTLRKLDYRPVSEKKEKRNKGHEVSEVHCVSEDNVLQTCSHRQFLAF